MPHISMPSIDQFRQIIKNISNTARYMGVDENGDPIFDRNIKLPVLKAKGTVKLHGCFDKNTLITLSNGEHIPIKDVKKNNYILSYDFDKKEIVNDRVIKTFKFTDNKEWIKLTFDNNTVIECTEDHLFFTENRGWVKAKNLTEYDSFITL